ncbi:MAG: Tfp pilus assembly protein FimT/FimU [Myxococcaceae bacterium]
MNARGLTLIEIMVALFIAVVLFGAVITGMGAITGTKAKAAAGELSGTIRSLYDTANLSGKTCRLVFQLPSPKDEDSRTSYWAECAEGAVTTAKDRDEALKNATKEQEDLAKGRKPEHRTGSSNAIAAEQEKIEARAKFADFTDETIAKRELPPAVHVTVWTKHQRDEAKSGLAYLYFFPQGYTERAMVKLKQGDNVWTINVQPLTGKANVVAEDLEIPKS